MSKSGMFVCLCVPLRKTRFPVDLRLQVEECIANIDIALDIFVSCGFTDLWYFEKVSGFGVFANRPTVPNGRVSRGRVCGCGCWR